MPRTRWHGFRPPFQYLAEHAEVEPSWLIYITDGCSPTAEHAPNYPVLWLLTSDGEKPATWGWSIKFKSEESRSVGRFDIMCDAEI